MNDKPFKRQPHKMVKRTEIIRRQQPTKCVNVFDHLVELALKGLSLPYKIYKTSKLVLRFY